MSDRAAGPPGTSAEDPAETPQVEAALAATRTNPDDPRAWRRLGECRLEADEAEAAAAAFASALALARGDAALAYLFAKARLDAGLPAVEAWTEAVAASRDAPAALLGMAAALLAEGRADEADTLLAGRLAAQPEWVEGQDYLAKLRWRRGDPGYDRGFRRALAIAPASTELWRHRIALAMHAGDHPAALAAVAAAEAATGASPTWLAHRAVCLDELGEHAAAATAFAALGAPGDSTTAVRVARHQLRTGQAAAVFATAQPWLGTPAGPTLWPYVALAWRITGDRRWAWLEERSGLIGIYDLAPALGDLGPLAALLRRLHGSAHQPIDQSLRHGTQTDGYLLARAESEIRGLRRVLARTVGAHIAQLDRRDPFHPSLAPPRDRPVRFSGAWSARLTAGGHHAHHVHPGGWFSSALYVSLPGPGPGEHPQAGWLALGEPDPTLGLDLGPVRMVEPVPGRLVLFPSTLWHGTRPFAAGERLTVAFDVARPAA